MRSSFAKNALCSAAKSSVTEKISIMPAFKAATHAGGVGFPFFVRLRIEAAFRLRETTTTVEMAWVRPEGRRIADDPVLLQQGKPT
jgi:hypothetical protein